MYFYDNVVRFSYFFADLANFWHNMYCTLILSLDLTLLFDFSVCGTLSTCCLIYRVQLQYVKPGLVGNHKIVLLICCTLSY